MACSLMALLQVVSDFCNQLVGGIGASLTAGSQESIVELQRLSATGVWSSPYWMEGGSPVAVHKRSLRISETLSSEA